jgi:chaperonin GroEL
VQNGLASLAEGANPVELVEGLELAVDETVEALKRSTKSLDGVMACAPLPALQLV